MNLPDIHRVKGRQREVIDLLLKGHTREQIMAKLGITCANYVNARRRAYEKIGVENDVQLLALAVHTARNEVFQRLRAEGDEKSAKRLLEPLAFIEGYLP